MRNPIRANFLLGAILFVALFSAPVASGAEKPARGIDGNDWFNWRGPEYNGVSQEKGLVSSWTKEDENLVWKAPIGGRSTPIIMDGRAYLIHLTGQKETWQEEIMCLDSETGKTIWTYKTDIFMTDTPEERVGWTSPAGDPETGNIYTNGVQGLFICLNRDGKVLWQHSLGEEFGKISGFGSRTFTPLVDQDLVVVGFNNSGLGDHGKPATRMVAFDKKTGEVRWWYTPASDVIDTNYSCPIAAVMNGQRLLIYGSGHGFIHAIKAATGQEVWTFKMGPGPVNVSPVIKGNNIYIAYSEENITGRVVCIDGTGTGDVSKTHMKWEYHAAVGYSSPTIHESQLFVVENNGTMLCLDTETGKLNWKQKVGKVSKGSPVWADGKLYYANVGGTFQILQPEEKSCKILSKLEFAASDGMAMDLTGSAAIANGKLYFMTRENFYCVGAKDFKKKPIAIPPPEASKAEGEAAFIQVTPADIQIPKDGKAKFKARKFDAKGRLIGETEAAWSLLDGRLKGAMDPDGTYTPDATVVAQFGVVEAAVGGLKGQARVRVMPSFPINTDFEKIPEGLSPVSWVGATKVKYNVVKEGDGQVLKKLFDAKILHSNVYITSSHSKNYTIQADVRGAKGDHDLPPDMGLINSRYVFDLMGATQQLRLIGWIPRPSRVSKMIDYKWEAGVWYTMKCRVDYEGTKGTVRGKVWKRGEPEPKDWTIELEDPLPYREGSPGLTCYPMGEVFYDNVKVELNK